MNKLCCDRCKKLIMIDDKEKSLAVKLIKMDDNNLLNISDLCPKCSNQLNRFLKGDRLKDEYSY